MNKELIIVPGFTQAGQLSVLGNRHNDFLALTPAAMHQLDRIDVSYRIPSDLCDRRAYQEKILHLQRETEVVFKTVDAICSQAAAVSYAYSGNILYFVKLFANLIYLEQIVAAIKNNYSRVRLCTHSTPEPLDWGSLTFDDLRSIPLAYGLERKVRILNHLLQPEVITGRSPMIDRVPDYIRARAFAVNTPERIIRGIREKRIAIPKPVKEMLFRNSGRKRLVVVQDGYEVGYLRKFLSKEFDFITPTIGIRKTVSQLKPENHDITVIHSALTDFMASNLPLLQGAVKDLFRSYHREIVGRLGFFKYRVSKVIQETKPSGFLFSAGTRDVVDLLIAEQASRRAIPLFTFQHGGTLIFFNSPYQNYIETNTKIKKVLYLSAQAEEKHVQNSHTRCIVSGSPAAYQKTQGTRKSVLDRALYCSGPLPFYSYNGLLHNVSDARWYQITREILSNCNKAGIAVDIKLHPIEQIYGYHYFKSLSAAVGNGETRIIYGRPAESVASRYGLIILDFVATAIFPFMLALKVPVILWQQDMGILNPLSAQDVKNRCHLVSDGDSLSRLLEQYRAGRLSTKWSPRIIDRYVYPVGKGHPGRRIAASIKSICNENRTSVH